MIDTATAIAAGPATERDGRLVGMAAVKLLRAVRQWSQQAGAADLHLNVTTAIAPARTDKVLRRMGFRQTGGNYVLEGVG